MKIITNRFQPNWCEMVTDHNPDGFQLSKMHTKKHMCVPDEGAAMQRARDELREQVAALAVKGAQQILTREINPQVHADLLANLKKEL